MREVELGRRTVPVLGQGTWRLGEKSARRREEAEALREGVELGMTVIDTAEMYGDGATESFLGEALTGIRNRVYLVSKVYPQNSGRGRIERACEASLRRMRTDRLDLYLLHWRGSVPLAETIEGMEALKTAGKIGDWGVSNFDTSDMDQLIKAGGEGCVANQILYNPTRRNTEYDLLPAIERRNIVTMAYSPIEQGALPQSNALAVVAHRYSVTVYQVALAWALRRPHVVAMPKASNLQHVHENAAAAGLVLQPDDLALIDRDFPPPKRRAPLEML